MDSEMTHLWVMRRVGAQGHIKELEELNSGMEAKGLTPEDATSHQDSLHLVGEGRLIKARGRLRLWVGVLTSGLGLTSGKL